MVDLSELSFSDTPGTFIPDSAPTTVDVEHPCERCGQETGWSGRGRRKRFCDACKPARSGAPRSAVPKVSGNASNTAAQAAKTLVGINNMLAMVALATGFPSTAKQIMLAQEDFESQAYQALLTDPKFAAQILSTGAVSGKAMLGLAYGSMLVGIAPTVSEELKAKKAAREEALEAE